MKAQIKEAVEYMVSTYQSLESAAKGFAYLNVADVEAELKKAKNDTAEFVALSVLFNSLKPQSAAKEDVQQTD
jgi:hypothetical protein